MPQRASDDTGGLMGVTERISRNESAITDLERRMVNLEDKTDSVARLGVVVEYMTKSTEDLASRMAEVTLLQTKQSERISETLNNIDRKLSVLDNDQRQVKKEAEDDRGRIKNLEDESKGKDKNIIKRAVDFVIAVALAYILLKLGLK